MERGLDIESPDKSGGADADYIIVGAGSAGCVLAERLSADGRHRVLLLEEGGDDASPWVSMPKGFAKLSADPRAVRFSPTTAHDGIPAETWINGRMLGGSSSVNGLMYFRGHPEDYDEWRDFGASGWDWSALEPAFTAIEAQLHPTVCDQHTGVGDRLIAAAEAMGVPRVDNLNHPGQFGVGYAPRTIWRGRRMSAARAFLRPARGRANLRVETGVKVSRVMFDGRRAVGVAAQHASGPIAYRAAREVILSAGALGSPQLLQRSGVGPASALRSLGVEVVHDSPGVGANLLEHRLLMMHYRLSAPISLNPQLRGLRLLGGALRYALTRSGPLAGGSYDVGAFFKTDPALSRPDCELLMAPYGFHFAGGRVGPPPFHSFHMFGYPLRSRSQGSILIGGPGPAAPPTIKANYLSDPYDRQVTVAMFRFLRRLAATSPIAEVIAEELNPGREVETDEEIIEAFRTRGQVGLHVCGTVAMGDAGAPLDPELRVRGVDGLRVVDGSVMPTMVSANTNGPIMAVGWRGAELILRGRN